MYASTVVKEGRLEDAYILQTKTWERLHPSSNLSTGERLGLLFKGPPSIDTILHMHIYVEMYIYVYIHIYIHLYLSRLICVYVCVYIDIDLKISMTYHLSKTGT